MADKKISQLTGATTPLAGTEVLPIVQSGSTVKVAVSDVTAGRAITATSITVGSGRTRLASTYVADVPGPTGNDTGILFGGNTIFPCNGSGTITNGVASLGSASFKWYDLFLENNVVVSAGKGIDFSANTHAAGMTSELLNWYEEGTWTPSVSASSGTITTVGTVVGRYTRVGRIVTVYAAIPITDNGTGAGALQVTGIPFTVSSDFSLYPVTGYNDSSAKTIGGALQASNATIYLRYYDATYPVATGQTAFIQLSYQI